MTTYSTQIKVIKSQTPAYYEKAVLPCRDFSQNESRYTHSILVLDPSLKLIKNIKEVLFFPSHSVSLLA